MEIADLTNGEASAIIDALRDLHHRGVVNKLFGSGSQPSAWTFTTDLGRWRGFSWITSAKSTAALVFGCNCVGPFAFSSEFPDQGSHLRRTSPNFVVIDGSGAEKSRRKPVELRRYREQSDGNAQDPCWKVVELRRYREVENSSYLASSSSSKEELSLEGPERQTLLQVVLQAAARAVARPGQEGWFSGEPRKDLERVVATWSSAQIEWAVEQLERARTTKDFTGKPLSVVAFFEGVSHSPAFPMDAA